LSGKCLTRRSAHQIAENIIPVKKKQRKNNAQDLGQSELEEQKVDQQEKNVSFVY
jgi:hypothetical protein